MNDFILKLNDNDKISKLDLCTLKELMQQIEKVNLPYRDNLYLPNEATFGLEIEYENVKKEILDIYMANKYNKWQSTYDISLDDGGELVSPILTDKKETWEDLEKICTFLSANNPIMNINAGGHIHVGSHILTDDFNLWRKFLKAYTFYESDLLYFLFGEDKRERGSFYQYARPVAEIYHQDLELLNSFHSFEEFYDSDFITSGKNRALVLGGVTINPSSMQKDNTIEFRGANSSDKAIIWQNNVNTVTKLMLAASKDLIDEEKLDYRLVEEPASSNNFFNSLELIDTIFDNNLDKIYFLKQYTKTFNFQPAKKMVKKI